MNLLEKSLINIAQEKDVILYGLGVDARGFFDLHGNDIVVKCVIDNDPIKQGYKVGELIAEAFQTINESVEIVDRNTLPKFDPTDTVVLIASRNCHNEIRSELLELGFGENYLLYDFIEGESIAAPGVTQLDKKNYAIECLEAPVENKKIFFSSYSNYSDHGKYIAQALESLQGELDLVWIVNDLKTELHGNMRKVLSANWKKTIYEAETAAIWIFDDCVPDEWVKRPEQIYIQTKHWGSVTLKRFYLDVEAFAKVPKFLNMWKRESEIIDYIIVGSEFDKNSCKTGFEFDRGFMEVGSPRSDGLFHEIENKQKVYAYYKLDNEIHVALYAPTYRFDKNLGEEYHTTGDIEIDYEDMKTALEDRFGGDWIIALRLHPSVANKAQQMTLLDYVIDVGMYEDSEELVSAFDIMITDYSSIMFEPAYVHKPVFLFAPDLGYYTKNEYEFLIDYATLPFPIAETNGELHDLIINFDKQEYDHRLDVFFDKYGVHEDGHASERAAEFILKLIDGESK